MSIMQKIMETVVQYMPDKEPDPLIHEKHGYVGKPLSRVDGQLKVKGAATFSAEFKFENVAHAALEACTNQGFQVAVAITDADGELMVMLRGDGAGVHLLDAARRKAFTAASSGARTSAWEKAIDERSGVPDPHIVELQNVLVVGGGVPILFGKERIGGIGVSGSPGVRYDEDCADTGLRAVDGLDEHVGR